MPLDKVTRDWHVSGQAEPPASAKQLQAKPEYSAENAIVIIRLNDERDKSASAALRMLAAKATGTVTPPTDRAPEMSTVIGTAVSRVLLHEVDAKTAACNAEPQIKALLAAQE